MNYNFLQKITSFILIFLFFFGITFRIPLQENFFNKVSAKEGNERYNLVSIFVEKNIYPEIQNELNRYTKDITGVLEKTKVIIVPVEQNIEPFVVASLNEKFYFDGYKGDSKLIGTILVGKISIPVVYDGSSSARTIYPYVDFEDKAYIYNHETKKYERNTKNKNGLKAEIWHSLIRPNDSDKTEVEALKEFFDKDHDFYIGEGLFEKEKGIINGKLGEEVSKEHEPYVFYYDGIRENKAIVYKNYLAYLNKLRFIEDLSYNRYTKELSNLMKNLYIDGDYNEEQKNLIKKLTGVDINKKPGELKTEAIPDIHTRRIIQNSTKNFIEIYNKGVFGEIEKFVHNAGRYNKTVKVKRATTELNQARVNVDTVPEIITKLDEISRLTIKQANTDLEGYIDDLVRNKGLSRYLPLLQRYSSIEREGIIKDIESFECLGWKKEKRIYYKNILHGKIAKTIGEKDYILSKELGEDVVNPENGAKTCTIYRGSLTEEQYLKIKTFDDYNKLYKTNDFYNEKRGGFRYGKLVEANRARAVYELDEKDLLELKNDLKYVFEKYSETPIEDVIKDDDDNNILSLGQLDINILKKESKKKCLKPLKDDDKPSLMGWFAKNSSLNINTNNVDGGALSLFGVEIDGEEKHAYLKGSIIPLFDINGSKNIYNIYADPNGFYGLEGEELNEKLKKVLPSASQCLKPNLLTKRVSEDCEFIPYEEQDPFMEYQKEGKKQFKDCHDIFTLPIEGQSKYDWSCKSENIPIEFDETFTSLYKKIKDKEEFEEGERKIIYLGMGDKTLETTHGYVGGSIVNNEDEKVVNEYKEGGLCDKEEYPQYLRQYYYKKIYSDIKHKSPNKKEYYDQIKGKTAYSLPVDKDRYIDFIAANGNNFKIYYPYLFRIIGENPSLEQVKQTLDDYLDYKSKRINETIEASDPEILEGYDREIYEYLKIADFPEADIDLKEYLKNKPSQEFEINGDKKIVSYYDMLVFALFWKNQRFVSNKYKYVMKYYLSDQFDGNKYNFPLIENKKIYEIAYLGEHGNAKNMFVRVDPKLKRKNPFGELEQKNIDLKNKLYNSNIGAGEEIIEDNSKKCAPPEGVSLLKWPQALECWVKDMLPPKIKVSRGTCGESWDKGVCKLEDLTKKLLGSSHVEPSGVCSKADIEAVNRAIKECDKDENKNGISDCTDKYLKKIELSSNYKKYSLNTNGQLIVKLKTEDLPETGMFKPFDNVLNYENTIEVYFKLIKAEVAKDSTKNFSDENKKVIFDLKVKELSDDKAIKELSKYIGFTPRKIRVKNGIAKTAFSSKTTEGNFYFQAYAILEETKNKKTDLKLLQSDEIKVEVRAQNLFVTDYLIYKDEQLNKITGDSGINTVVASNSTNIFISNSLKLEKAKQSVLNDDIKKEIFNSSSAKEKLVFDVSNIGLLNKKIDLSQPLEIIIEDSLEKDQNKRIIFKEKRTINTFSPLLSIKKAGDYKLIIIDANGLKYEKEFFVKADLAVNAKLEMSSSIMETGGNVISGFVYLYDKYNNLASGELYDLDLSLNGSGIEFLDKTENKKLNVFEGAKLFKIRSTKNQSNNTITAKIFSKIKNINLETKANVRTLKNIKLNVKINADKLVVGEKEYSFDIEITDENGNILNGFNSQAYVTVNNVYFSIYKDYLNIKNGKASGIFKTRTVAVKDKSATIEIKVEGIKDTFRKSNTIYPEKPIYIDYHLEKDKLVALDYLGQRPTDLNETYLFVELKDRYNNLVFEDKKDENKYTFYLKTHDILERRVHKFDLKTKPKNNPNSDFRDLKGSFILNAITEPGLGYFKIFVTPKLEDNTFEILNKDTNEKEIIHGLSETTGKLTTYYFYNKSNIKGAKFNALYTTLLGADYGNVFVKDYLAGTMLFEKENRSLAVTSLLDSPYKKSYVLSISRNGNINFINSYSDLAKNIKVRPSFEDYGFSLALYNESINSFVGQIYYNLGKDIDLKKCEGNNLNFINCKPEKKDKTTIFLKSSKEKYEVLEDGEDLVLKNKINGEEILRLDNSGKIQKAVGVDLVFSRLNTGNGISFIINDGGVGVGVIKYIFDNTFIERTKSPNYFKNGLSSRFKLGEDNSFIGIFINSGYYDTVLNYSSGANYEGVSIIYLDPFENRYDLNKFAKQTDEPYENFVKNAGVGWKEGNKTLLSFAAGKNVGEAVKDYQSFFTINLGDPVIYLKKIRKNIPKTPKKRKFDATIGKLITSGDDIVTYSTFDYNNDKIEDIVVLRSDGGVYLFEGTKAHERFINKGKVVKFGDIGNKSILVAGDFFGDGYGDLALTDSKGKIVFINNNKKDFIREKNDLFGLKGIINQLERFDMDHDGKMDLISFDLSGELNIFYGDGNGEKPKFIKNTLSDGLGLTLTNESITGEGALYFDGLYQIKDQKNGEKPDELVNNQYFENLIFEKIAYDPNLENKKDLTKEEKQNKIVDSIETNNNAELNPNDKSLDGADKEEFAQYKKDLQDSQKAWENIFEYTDTKNPGLNFYDDPGEQQEKITTFIKNKYVKSQAIDITKNYIDEDGGVLLPGDKVKVKVIIKNNSAKPLNKVAYIEKIPELFLLKKDSIKVNGEEFKTKNVSNPKYSFLIDFFNIPIDGELVLEYELEVLKYKMGKIKVGLFEKGEDGYDEYGDVVFKENKYNCGDPYTIFRSISAREYKEGLKNPVCKAEIPDTLKGNDVDKDGNNIPDKYDDLIKSAIDNPGNQNSDFTNFAKDGLKIINQDTDGDGIPDLEDNSVDFNDDNSGFLNKLDKFEEEAEKAVDNLEFLIQGFGCGFGGGACVSSPLNWAPLAPGSDPIAFGSKIGDGLKVDEGIPIFSMVTRKLVGGVCLPLVWPIFDKAPGCAVDGAGGMFGTSSTTNFLRIFWTPTLTGAQGLAICFGAPASKLGNLPPKGVSPITPGGNCVVMAVPLFGCSGDGSDGNIEDIGEADINNGEYGVREGNCLPSNQKVEDENPISIENAKDFINYKSEGHIADNFKEALKHIAKPGVPASIPKQPLFKLGNKQSAVGEIKVDVDLSEVSKGNFKDIVKMQMSRVPSFPSFIMEWVHEQIDEIITKLTDFPTLTIILPDFSGLIDYDWDNFGTHFLEAFELGKQEEIKRIEAIEENKVKPLLERKKALGCPDNPGALAYLKQYSDKKNLKCLALETEINKLKREQYLGTAKQVNSGIQSVYKFLGNIPIVNVYSQKIKFNIPIFDLATLDRALFEMQTARTQREREIKNAIANWSMGAYCDKLYTKAGDITKCKNDGKNKAIKLRINSQKLLTSLDRNIQILKEYKKLPEKLQLLIRVKEKRLQQVLCNIEMWTRILPTWLKLNGKRFKSWVELYVLIKAILKSWQALPDIFLDYEAECKQCKNERQDLMGYVFGLIDMLIPKLPIIKFPKWPDLIIDLHNIRAGISVALPDFDFRFVPINFPKLPQLFLPTRPDLYVEINLPEVPLLTDLKLPDLSFIKDLPDLPSLPEVQLPNLPPAPHLPKLFSSIDKFVDILKILTKAMCLLKQNPFIPEWRAGDQIAFITERGGYLKTDFMNIKLPQYKMTSIDAFAITTYVNLEFESDFVVDIVREIVAPLQDRLNDVINHLNIRNFKNWDFRRYGPPDIHKDIGAYKQSKKYFTKVGRNIFSGLLDMQEYMIDNRKEIKNSEFKKLLTANISSLGDSRTDKIKEILKQVEPEIERKLAGVDDLNKKLLKNNKEKFDTLKNIIYTEIKKNRELEKKLKTFSDLQKMAKKQANIDFMAENSVDSRIKAYNKKLGKYNKETIKAYLELTQKDKEVEEFKKIGDNIISRVDNGLENFSKNLKNQKQKRLLAYNKNRRLFAGDPNFGNKVASRKAKIGENVLKGCNSPYVYKGIYITEEGRQYRLFDYLDEVDGNEKVLDIDFDNDGDKDLLYLMNGQLYLKENLTEKEDKVFFNDDPIIYDKIDEFKENIIESINDFRESVGDNGAVNIQFSAPTNKNRTNFRIEFYEIVDKFAAKRAGITGYTPEKIRKYIIDSFVNIDDITSITPVNNYNNFATWFFANKYDYTKNVIYKQDGKEHLGYLNKDLAYIEKIGNPEMVKVKTYSFIEIKKGAKISAGTRIYAKKGARLKYLIYREGKDLPEEGYVIIPDHSGVTFQDDIEVDLVSKPLYIKSKRQIEVSGAKLLDLEGLPLLPGTRMEFGDKNGIYAPKDFIEIRYYNDYLLKMHFSGVKFYEITDLGNIKDSYLTRLNIKNDFYYSKILAFDNKKVGTSSAQLLISPQEYNDNYAPEIDLKGNILVPVYSMQETDISDYVYEDSGIENIKSVVLDEESAKDGKIQVIFENGSIKLKLGKYDEIIKKKVKLILTDANGNVGEGIISILVYPPVPQITSISEDLSTISGAINEKLEGEPISIFRYRAGVLTKLQTTSGNDKVYTDKEGNFVFKVNGVVDNKDNDNNQNKVEIFKEIKDDNGVKTKVKIAEVDKKTGKIKKIDNNSYIRVLASNDKDNDKGYLKIILSQNGKDLYYNYIVAPNTGEVNLVEDLDKDYPLGVYVKMIDTANYGVFKIGNLKKINPGALVIHKIGDYKTQYFRIFRDGRIEVFNNAKIRYSEMGNDLGFDLVVGEKVVAKVIIKTEDNFILR